MSQPNVNLLNSDQLKVVEGQAKVILPDVSVGKVIHSGVIIGKAISSDASKEEIDAFQFQGFDTGVTGEGFPVARKNTSYYQGYDMVNGAIDAFIDHGGYLLIWPILLYMMGKLFFFVLGETVEIVHEMFRLFASKKSKDTDELGKNKRR